MNTTARVEAAGHGGQTLITEPVRIAASVTDVTDLGVHQLRDVDEPLRLFQVAEEILVGCGVWLGFVIRCRPGGLVCWVVTQRLRSCGRCSSRSGWSRWSGRV